MSRVFESVWLFPCEGLVVVFLCWLPKHLWLWMMAETRFQEFVFVYLILFDFFVLELFLLDWKRSEVIVAEILLMEDILHQLIYSKYHII